MIKKKENRYYLTKIIIFLLPILPSIVSPGLYWKFDNKIWYGLVLVCGTCDGCTGVKFTQALDGAPPGKHKILGMKAAIRRRRRADTDILQLTETEEDMITKFLYSYSVQQVDRYSKADATVKSEIRPLSLRVV